MPLHYICFCCIQKNNGVAETDVVIETEDGDTAGDKPANGRPL